MLSERLPHPPLLFALIKASGVKEVTEHKVKSELIMSVKEEGMDLGGCRVDMHERKRGKGGVEDIQEGGGKREEDAFAAA